VGSFIHDSGSTFSSAKLISAFYLEVGSRVLSLSPRWWIRSVRIRNTAFAILQQRPCTLRRTSICLAAGPELRLELTVWPNGASKGPRDRDPGEYHRAEAELVGRAVVLTDGKAGTVAGVTLEEGLVLTRRVAN
jgi:hypothetical protein